MTTLTPSCSLYYVLDVNVRCGSIELRPITPRYSQALFRLCSDPLLTQHLQWGPYESIEDALEYIRDSRTLWHQGSAYLMGTYSEGLIGSTGISRIDEANLCGEVGSWIGRPYQGRGFNLPSKGAVFAFGFEVLGLQRLEMLVRTANVQSVRATTKLPGVAEEGIQRLRIRDRGGDMHDAHMFAITADNWTQASTKYPEISITGNSPSLRRGS